MTVLIQIGLIPFAVLGILDGQLVRVDSIGPAIGGRIALFAILGGSWGPVLSGAVVHRFAEVLPSCGLVPAGNVAVGGDGWPATAWIVIAAWTLTLTGLAVHVYQRDTARARRQHLLGSSDAFGRALVDSSEFYADHTERDCDALAQAATGGRIIAQHGL